MAELSLDHYDTILFDCDGVIWRNKSLIKGADRVIKQLREMSKRTYFISNNSGATRQQYVNKLQSFGIVATIDDVVCSSYATAQYLKEKNHQGCVYSIGHESVSIELEHAGIKCMESRLLHPINIPREGFESISVDNSITAVVVGFDYEFNYLKMAYAQRLLYKRPEIVFISTNNDPVYPTTESQVLPGAGSCAAGIATASQRKPFNIGKPQPYMFDLIKRRENLNPQTCLMIGDNLSTDILFGKNCGLKTLLVLTGVATLADIGTSEACPDYILNSIDELIPEF